MVSSLAALAGPWLIGLAIDNGIPPLLKSGDAGPLLWIAAAFAATVGVQAVTTKIHATEDIAEIMLESSQDICKLFNADRLTLYAVSDDRNSIAGKLATKISAGPRTRRQSASSSSAAETPVTAER